MDRLVLGCGYLGRRVADIWRKADDRVFAVTRHAEHAAEMREAGLLPLIADVTDVDSLADLPEVDTVLYSVGMDRTTGDSIEDVYVGGLENTLGRIPPPRKRMVYISSTGVYGQSSGEWVDEDSACHPDRAGGKACLAAERVLQESGRDMTACILRLAGIYGPHRLPRRKALLEGEPIAADPTGWLNLVHVEDAVRVITAIADGGMTTRTLNVSDGQPLTRESYFQEICRQLGAPEPRFSLPAEEGRVGSSKRVSNRALLNTLGDSFLFRSFADGLAAILQGESDSRCPGTA